MEGFELTRESEMPFIPLLGKAEVSRYGDILRDETAADIVKRVNYDFGKNQRSRFLSIYMGIRAAILDRCTEDFLAVHPEGVVLHLGCGLDARARRVGRRPALWVDVDLPDVIAVRRQFYGERAGYRMLAGDVTELSWLAGLDCPAVPALVVAEGLTMYLTEAQNRALFAALGAKFPAVDYVFDAYSRSAVSWSRYKNPVNKMGAIIRWGLNEDHVPPAVRKQLGQHPVSDLPLSYREPGTAQMR